MVLVMSLIVINCWELVTADKYSIKIPPPFPPTTYLDLSFGVVVAVLTVDLLRILYQWTLVAEVDAVVVVGACL